nr:hypothetical protein CFP56_33751 [Quercus suber]
MSSFLLEARGWHNFGVCIQATEVSREQNAFQTSSFNQSTSFANALPRCEISFFASLGISAYVWPSYSKHASQPGNLSASKNNPTPPLNEWPASTDHASLTEIRRTSGFYDFALHFLRQRQSSLCKERDKGTNVHTSVRP